MSVTAGGWCHVLLMIAYPPANKRSGLEFKHVDTLLVSLMLFSTTVQLWLMICVQAGSVNVSVAKAGYLVYFHHALAWFRSTRQRWSAVQVAVHSPLTLVTYETQDLLGSSG